LTHDIEPSHKKTKPLLRGVSHAFAAVASVVGAVLLWKVTEGDRPRQITMLIFGLSLIALYSASATYHLGTWRGKAYMLFRRMDHAMIFVLIAGTYTPFAWILLSGTSRVVMLALIWGFALAGMSVKIFFPFLRRRFSVPIYLGAGWLAVIEYDKFIQALPSPGLTLLAAGCGDNSGNPTGYSPEGQASPAILLLDVQPLDADTSQVFVQAFVASPPPSDGFRFYVNPDDAGYRPANEAPLPPSTTFDSGWSLFTSVINGYDPTTTSLGFIARGARGGVESLNAPVTSAGYIPASSALALTRRQPVTLLAPADSADITEFEFDWAPVPGAGSYLLQAFNASTGELGLLVHVPASGATPLQLETAIQNLVPYRWFVTAYDGGGRAFAVSGQRLFRFIPPEDALARPARVRVAVGAATH
jgi:hemolysin III